MKQSFRSMAQQGFTLLELLVVITLLAILSVGALVAYEGIGENAQNVGATNNIVTADSAIRTYAALENVYPNQWDNLVNSNAAGAPAFLAAQTKDFIGSLDLDAVNTADNAVGSAIFTSLINAGLDEFQSLLSTSTFPPNTNPNEAWNESAPNLTGPADEMELGIDEATGLIEAMDTSYKNISIFASGGDGACTVAGISLASNVADTPATVANSAALNRINDVLGDDNCHLVVAVGFGKDVPGTTLDSKVAISTAPTYVSDNINPSENYARYIALFHIGSDVDDAITGDPTTTVTDFRNKAKLIAVVDTEGRGIDESIAGAFAED